MEADAEPLAQLGLAPGAPQRIAVGLHDSAHGAALRHAASDEPLDAVLGHEVEAARGRALDGLPALHRVDGSRHQGEILKVVAAIGDAGGNGVVLALVGEGGVVERLEDDLDLLLEELAVGGLVEQGGPEGVDLAGVVSASDPEAHAAAGQHVHRGEVLGQAQGMPHRRDVEAAPHLEPLGLVAEVEGQQEDVRDALVAFPLEVVLGEPEGVVPAPVEEPRQVARLGEDGDEVLVGEHAAVHGGAAVADVVHVDVAGVQAVELGDHVLSSPPRIRTPRFIESRGLSAPGRPSEDSPFRPGRWPSSAPRSSGIIERSETRYETGRDPCRSTRASSAGRASP